jgi:RimJ/RimL family protein N-acetyltransferase
MTILKKPVVWIREPTLEDEANFLAAMLCSQVLHHPWVTAPQTPQEFRSYMQRYQQANQKSFLVCDQPGNIAGVFNVNEIVRGFFQSAYLGFYAVEDYAGKGYMSVGLALVLKKVFTEMNLHRLEANIQPENFRSINLVKNNGFRKEGYSTHYLKINGVWRDHERWAITFEDFMNFTPT